MNTEHHHTETVVSLYDVYLEAALGGRAEDPSAFLARHGSDDASLLRSLKELRGMVGRGEVADSAPPRDRIGEFRLLRPLGQGGMGQVFLAEQPSLGRCVALKLIKNSGGRTLRERFRREAQALAAVRHPHVVSVFDFGEENGVLYLAMELVPGDTLADRLGLGEVERGALLGWLAEVADALAAVHAAGIIHRDIKPSNICITPEGRAVLIDFGLARQPGVLPTITHDFVGTPAYASPEQIEGGRLDGRTDIYSLGVVLYRGLTGQLPFGSKPIAKVIERIRSWDPSAPEVYAPDLPPGLSALTMRCIARDRARRPERAGDLARALRGATGAPPAAVARPAAEIGGCRLEELVGRGAQGSVYKARHLRLDKPVAVKLIEPWTPAQAQRFLREAKLASRIRHPHLVRVWAAGKKGGRCYLVMDYVEGENLQERVSREGPLPLPLALRCAQELGRALSAAHAAGVLHRDVKPANAILGDDGRLRLSDFGLARDAEDASTLTATGALLGTPATLAPEVCAGETASEASDQYALAVTVYFLLTGRFPFTGKTPLATVQAHIREPVPDPRKLRPDCPPGLAAALRRGLAKDPARRHGSVGDFVHALRAPAPAARRPWWMLALVGVALLAALPWWLGGEGEAPPAQTEVPAEDGAPAAVPAPPASILDGWSAIRSGYGPGPGEIWLEYDFSSDAQLRDFEASPGVEAARVGEEVGFSCAEDGGYWIHRGRFGDVVIEVDYALASPDEGGAGLVYVAAPFTERYQVEYSFYDGAAQVLAWFKSQKTPIHPLFEGRGPLPEDPLRLSLERRGETLRFEADEGFEKSAVDGFHPSGQPGLMVSRWYPPRVRSVFVRGRLAP